MYLNNSPKYISIIIYIHTRRCLYIAVSQKKDKSISSFRFVTQFQNNIAKIFYEDKKNVNC